MSKFRFLIFTAIVLAAMVGVQTQPILAEDSSCVQCHTDAEKLKEIINQRAKGWPAPADAMPDTLPRVLVTDKFFEDENHADIACEECHGGHPDTMDFQAAHKGVNLEPDHPGPGVCSDCHDEAANFKNSLHNSLAGMKKALEARANPDPKVQTELHAAFASCARCHATCGQCHVRKPQHAGSGFLDGHAFIAAPDEEKTCGACHVALFSEFKGEHQGLEPDVHQEQGMNCLDCHTAEEMHGTEEAPGGRYAAGVGPKCLDCHKDIFEDGSENKKIHGMHKTKASCHVCHSQAYTNCSSCHLDKPWGEPGKFKSWMAFKSGFNPNPTETRPEKFVTLRHVPVTKDMFAPGVKDALTNFDAVPTWKPATPHNIRRQTAQNRSCNNCHGQWELFLLLKDVDPDEKLANRPVIVPPGKVPAKIKEEGGE